jgi:hypothetical protein
MMSIRFASLRTGNDNAFTSRMKTNDIEKAMSALLSRSARSIRTAASPKNDTIRAINAASARIPPPART